jgi:hypothetical protein
LWCYRVRRKLAVTALYRFAKNTPANAFGDIRLGFRARDREILSIAYLFFFFIRAVLNSDVGSLHCWVYYAGNDDRRRPRYVRVLSAVGLRAGLKAMVQYSYLLVVARSVLV